MPRERIPSRRLTAPIISDTGRRSEGPLTRSKKRSPATTKSAGFRRVRAQPPIESCSNARGFWSHRFLPIHQRPSVFSFLLRGERVFAVFLFPTGDTDAIFYGGEWKNQRRLQV